MNKKVLFNRIAWIERNIKNIKSLPLDNYETFIQDKRIVRSAELYLRRGLEAVLDLGRYILTNGFAVQVATYEDIAEKLGENKVLSQENIVLLKTIASKCLKLTHYRSSITEKDIYHMCRNELDNLSQLKNAYLEWIQINLESKQITLH